MCATSTVLWTPHPFHSSVEFSQFWVVHQHFNSVPQALLRVIRLMQVHRGVMPSHTMYALNMERILSRLWHPSHEELEQDHVHRQRLAAKEGVLIS